MASLRQMESEIQLFQGDCLEVLKQFNDFHFDAACFSPPYGLTDADGFNVRYDFGYDRNKFIPYMLEICRVSRLCAVNLTQKVYDTQLMPFTEELVMLLQHSFGITLFDRWIVLKPAHMPRRGNRALTRYEFVLLFTGMVQAEIVKYNEGSTVIPVTNKTTATDKTIGDRPYFPEIPQQVISMYVPENGWVLDPFVGTGTTLFEAYKQGKNAVGIELDSKKVERLAQHIQQWT